MLSEEEKKAIRNLENLSEFGLSTTLNQADLDKMKTVLNSITGLEKENEEKDNQIDLMIEEYEYNARINFKNFCEDELRKDNCIQDCKSCAKQYFEKLVKEKG
jgi:Asp-tRNA(Asn)/Glu-tRNA(Gln) amidotransferase C subunit